MVTVKVRRGFGWAGSRYYVYRAVGVGSRVGFEVGLVPVLIWIR